MVIASGGTSGGRPQQQGQQGEVQSQENGGQQQEPKDEIRRPPYTMPGVLHFIQHEWGRYEMERAKWEMERAEMQARISFLQGERKGQENLKNDLIRRIKMLEFCLKQERAKSYRLTHNGEDPPDIEETEETDSTPMDVDAFPNHQSQFKAGRQLLKQYLEEIGYSETVLDVRSFRVKNLLGLLHSDVDAPQHRRTKEGIAGSDSDHEERARRAETELDTETTEALDEFDFLAKEEQNRDEWSVDQGALEALKEKYKSEKRQKRSSGSSSNDGERKIRDEFLPPAPPNMSYGKGKKGEYMDLNDALGLLPDDNNIDIKDEFTGEDSDSSWRAAKWSLRMTLRSHLDSIRAMQFHPVEPVLFTASEDGTCKLWNLENAKHKEDKHGSPCGGALEPEPVYTFRGHLGAVLAMELSPTGDHLYTGGLDGVVCCWNVPSSNTDCYDVYDPRVLSERLRGHTDAVWAITFHSSDNRLVSASADGTIKLWEPGNFSESLLRTINSWVDGLIPTSVDFVSTEPQQLLAAYTQSVAGIIDIETGQNVLKFDFGDDIVTGSRITKIISHPTMPATLTAGDDRRIRYFDNKSGKLINSAVAHVEGISSLALDPNGLYLLSGSHDGSLRLWNMEKRVCLQEIAAHRKKYDASVTCVAFHPSRPLIGSAGADSLAKVFGTTGSVNE